jgi:hypothetical protein
MDNVQKTSYLYYCTIVTNFYILFVIQSLLRHNSKMLLLSVVTDRVEMHVGLNVQRSLNLSRLNRNWNCSANFRKNFQCKISWIFAQVFWNYFVSCYGRMDSVAFGRMQGRLNTGPNTSLASEWWHFLRTGMRYCNFLRCRCNAGAGPPEHVWMR